MNLFEKIDKKITHIGIYLLLAFVIIFIFIIPFLPTIPRQIAGGIIFPLIVITSVFTLQTGRKLMVNVVVIALITEWVSDLYEMSLLNYISLSINIIFFQIIVVKMIIQIAKSKKTDEKVIFESIVGYLMLGLMYTTWVALAMLYDPGAFSFAAESSNTLDYTYFTFITMTTLGYGDITPVLPFAKSLAILISTSGQIYVAVIIAMLVGKYAAAQKTN